MSDSIESDPLLNDTTDGAVAYSVHRGPVHWGPSVDLNIEQLAEQTVAELVDSILSSVAQLRRRDPKCVSDVYESDPNFSNTGAKVHEHLDVALHWTDPVGMVTANTALGVGSIITSQPNYMWPAAAVIWTLTGVNAVKMAQNSANNVALSAADYLDMAKTVCQDWKARKSGKPAPSAQRMGPITTLTLKAIDSLKARSGGSRVSTTRNTGNGARTYVLLSALEKDLQRLVQSTEPVLYAGLDPEQKNKPKGE